jgi:C4-dicarboxylate transporter DctM subunit
MSPTLIGIIGIIILFVIMLLGFPLAIAMALVGFAGICYLASIDAAMAILARTFWQVFSDYSLTVIPMFVLMGVIAFNSGITSRLYKSANSFLGHFRGGLAMATVGGSALFGAICGSSSAATAAIGKVALPEMKKYNYEPSIACASIAAGGGLSILIPPSTGFIILAILMEQSVGELFIAGILPGILLTILFLIVIFILCRMNPSLGPAGAKSTWKARIASLSGSIDMLILFLLVMGGLFTGVFTPTEAGAAGAGGALILSLVRRQLSLKGFLNSLLETVELSSIIYLLLAGAFVLGPFMAYSRITSSLIDWLTLSHLSPYLIMWLIIAAYLVAGCF